MSQLRLDFEALRKMVAEGCSAAELWAVVEPILVRLGEQNRARQQRFRARKRNVTKQAYVTLRVASSKINELDDNVTRNVTRQPLRDTNEINELDRNVTRGDTSTLTYLLKERKKEEDSKEERKKVVVRARGFRLPDDWSPSEADFAMAVEKLNGSAKLELEKFRDYWKAQPGQRGTKLDWDATFRNWVRNAKGAPKKPKTFDVRRHLV